MENRIIYQSKGISKKYAISMIISGIFLELIGIFLLIEKKSTYVLNAANANNTLSNGGLNNMFKLQTKYVLASGPRLIFGIIIVVEGLIFLGMVNALEHAEMKMYNEYIEFSDCSGLTLLGISSSKFMKKIRLSYKDIIDLKSDNLRCQLYINLTTGKRYRVVCKDTQTVKGLFENKIQR